MLELELLVLLLSELEDFESDDDEVLDELSDEEEDEDDDVELSLFFVSEVSRARLRVP